MRELSSCSCSLASVLANSSLVTLPSLLLSSALNTSSTLALLEFVLELVLEILLKAETKSLFSK